MSRMILYMEGAVQGLGRFLEADKPVVLVFALLLAGWLWEKKPVGKKGRQMFQYTLVMSLLLLCPITAMVVMIYQTAYYDYEWAWSMVPLTAVIAYGAALLIERWEQQGKRLLGILGVAAVLCLCGNQGTVLTVESQEAEAWEDASEVLQELYDFGMGKQRILWAPKNIMEQVRRKDGKILLIYGRDMWDTKAGAYDYEVYSEALTNAYIWLEVMTEQAQVASIMADPGLSFAALCEEEDLNRDRENHLRAVLKAGANVLVLPGLVAEHIEESILKLAAEQQLSVQNTYTEEYTVYLLE